MTTFRRPWSRRASADATRSRASESIRTRIVLGVSVLAITAITMIAANAVLQVNTASRSSERATAALRMQTEFERLVGGILLERSLVYRELAFPRGGIGSSLDQIVADRRQAADRILLSAPGDRQLEGLVDGVVQATLRWHESWVTRVLPDADEGPANATSAGLGPAEEEAIFLDVTRAVAALEAGVLERADRTAASFSAQAVSNLTISVPIGLLLVAGVVLAARWLLLVVIRPLRALSATTQAQLRGEQVAFRSLRNDEIGDAARLLEQFRVQAQVRLDEARDEATRGAVLAQLGDLISFATSESEIVEATIRSLLRLVPARRGDLQLASPERERLIYAGAWGDNPPELGTTVAVDGMDRCPAIRRGTMYSVPDVADGLVFRCPAHPVESGALACVPLLAMGQPVGVIHLEGDAPFPPEVLGIASRIAEQVAIAIANARLMRTMESLAMTDGLTGLRNARFFDAHLEQELAAGRRDGQPVSLIMLDVDQFKEFNDTHGHPAGDEALRVIGRTIRSCVRASDVTARYGGEEFIIALHNTEREGAAVVAEKVRQAIAAMSVEIAPGRFAGITASLGVASTDGAADDMKSLVAAADAALYLAKTGGRDQVWVAHEDAGAAPPTAAGTGSPISIVVPRPARATGTTPTIRIPRHRRGTGAGATRG
jgi:diguanylate cyclase (GGDEF)-like protein